MIRDDLDGLPSWPFPEGFGMRPMQAGDEGLWEDIQRDAQPFFETKPGLFVQEFGDDLEAAWQRVFLIADPRCCAVGTMGAWYRSFQERDHGLIHWVSVRPAFQGMGLAKASLAAALEVLARFHERAYLVTQSRRSPAIGLYLDAGFRPHVGSERDRAIWADTALTMSRPGHRDRIDRCLKDDRLKDDRSKDDAG
jgi:GNAT superfamily N-acetyltransferase